MTKNTVKTHNGVEANILKEVIHSTNLARILAVIPNYEWTCHACGNTNVPGISICKDCGCDGYASVPNIKRFRQAYLNKGGKIFSSAAMQNSFSADPQKTANKTLDNLNTTFEGNEHIFEYLDYYIHLPIQPEYAVLITGSWGSGKSSLVRRAVRESGVKQIISVSLYGITDFQGIEDEFFRQLHPVLASKGMAIAGKIAKGILKSTLKIDLSKNESATISVPELELPSFLKDTEGCILVFDDLERCSINICDLLGYINHFVELNGYKVILIANETEIIGRATSGIEEQQPYRQIKEKLIGKTFEVTPDMKSAVSAFLENGTSEIVREVFQKNEKLIQKLFEASTYKNLRHLRQALLDFDRLLRSLTSEAKEKDALITHLLTIFLIFSFEIKSAKINPDDIAHIDRSLAMQVYFKNGDGKTQELVKSLTSKYQEFGVQDTLLEPSLWYSFFAKGIINIEGIKKSILQSSYFYTDTTPNWIKLWHFFEMRDEDFERIYSLVESEFDDMKYEEVGTVNHVVSTFLLLSDKELIKRNKSEIINTGKKIIEKLRNQNKLPLPAKFPNNWNVESGWGGLGYHSKDAIEFKEFLKFIDDQAEMGRPASRREEAEELLELMAKDTDKFFRSLILNNDPDNRFYDIPILTHIDATRFVDEFLNLDGRQQRLVAYMFDTRYEYENFNLKLKEELIWIKAVIDFLEQEYVKRKGKLSSYTIRNTIDESLSKSKAKLENV
jgi:GTPase SAR1 family protein